MLQAIGLTSAPGRDRPPVVDDLTFEAPPGRVTVLLGAPGSGKTTALRLMLELESGRGVTYFRGRPLHRIGHPAREVGVLLGDVPGHPARTVRGQLRMLCAAAGVPAVRADELLEVVGLAGLGDQRIGTLSAGMDRRLGLASALLGDPHTLLLDEPAKGLSPRERSWMHGLLRAHAAEGGTVLHTTSDPKEAAVTADRVVTIDGGRLVADQAVADFSRTRLRPRVAVRTPHAARLAAVVSREARAARRPVEVVAEDGSRLSVYGSSCAEIGDAAYRHGVPVHQLADEIGDAGPVAVPAARIPGRAAPRPASAVAISKLPPPITVRPARGPLRPLRYELRRLFGVRTTTLVIATVLLLSGGISVLLARSGRASLPDLLVAWPDLLPLPPAAFGAGLIGALSFGDEYRYPALAAGRGTVPRRLGLLLAKLTVSSGVALLLALLSVLADAEALRLVYGKGVVGVPDNALPLAMSWIGLSVGCAWAGLLAAGVFRMAAAGVAAVLAVPVLMVPLVQKLLAGPSARSIVGLPARLRELTWLQWPYEVDRWAMAAVRVVAQPVGVALSLSLSVLICAYVFTGLRGRARW
ncbi:MULTISPECIES: ABC transporter ATP-binding protein [unclassified Streptomyces]|uniref:ABC transporter ATP-binding protein n=1 Tax=Streptomyces TaxID=1883 RepID=UPI000223B42B|nr:MULTISPECIES: ABC transporter ATP-binding protein [unclassified Streptomyces]AEN12812.1 ABC transporter related protein [Streptomyces sp. SirexAA-E]MYR66186.1 ATP-binding cassette domain-containing protein [Streptomyces sp. SID4939]MYS00740.1 ATP-binding cassette domain-containing protein [Streptomyces sp. SID4940]MYT65683.1 ATP-binding cassette domain-containing protein [Streptomyces sp. SID8357]MYT84281.1 ATP-binding cassette domain-containing protein [Streptomyces sp. SID8360]